jgi:hypothetical protein
MDRTQGLLVAGATADQYSDSLALPRRLRLRPARRNHYRDAGKERPPFHHSITLSARTPLHHAITSQRDGQDSAARMRPSSARVKRRAPCARTLFRPFLHSVSIPLIRIDALPVTGAQNPEISG